MDPMRSLAHGEAKQAGLAWAFPSSFRTFRKEAPQVLEADAGSAPCRLGQLWKQMLISPGTDGMGPVWGQASRPGSALGLRMQGGDTGLAPPQPTHQCRGHRQGHLCCGWVRMQLTWRAGPRARGPSGRPLRKAWVAGGVLPAQSSCWAEQTTHPWPGSCSPSASSSIRDWKCPSSLAPGLWRPSPPAPAARVQSALPTSLPEQPDRQHTSAPGAEAAPLIISCAVCLLCLENVKIFFPAWRWGKG